MSKITDRTASARRNFLKLASLGTLAGGAVAVARPACAEAAREDRVRQTGYRETPHVKKAYELARF